MRIRCTCGKVLNVEERLLGKKVRCPGCKEILLATSEPSGPKAHETPTAPARPKKPADDAEDQTRQEDDERPQRKRKANAKESKDAEGGSKKTKQAASPRKTWLLIGVPIGAGAAVLAAGLLVFFLVGGFAGNDGSKKADLGVPGGAEIKASSRLVTIGEPRAVLTDHEQPITSLRINADGKWLASGSADATVRLWDLADPKKNFVLGRHKDAVNRVAFSPDGRLLASAGKESELYVWDVATKTKIVQLPGLASEITGLAFSSDGKFLAAGGFVRLAEAKGVFLTQHMILWDAESWREIAALTGVKGVVGDLGFSSGNSKLVIVDRITASLTLLEWQAKRPTPLKSGPGRNLAVAPDQKTFAIGNSDGMIRLWDVDSGENTATLPSPKAGVNSVAFSKDGKFLAAGSGIQTDDRKGQTTAVKIWEVASRQERAMLVGHVGSILAVAFTPDGKTLVSGGHDKTIRLWDVGKALE